ncbi:MAG: hypothetical protein ABIG44_17265 [Planctomycetota bacterium]
MRTYALLVVIACAPIGVRGQDRSPALIGLENAREQLRTGHVIWSTRCNRPKTPDDELMIHRWHSFDVPRYFTSQFTSDEYLVEDNGDPAGVVFPTRDGTPHPELGYLPMRYLRYEGAVWEHRDGEPLATVRRGLRFLPNPRLLGMTAVIESGADCHRIIWGHGEEYSYETRIVDGLYEVTRHSANGAGVYLFLLDPERGWNPVRYAFLNNDQVVREVRSTLKQYGDVWFPERIELYDREHEGGEEPTYVIDVLSASFNEPDHPKRLTPESIGIEVGTNITVEEWGSSIRRIGMFGWDKKKLVPLKELFERIRAGELETGPQTRAAAEHDQAKGAGMELFETEWERYVRRFIDKYRLNEQQAEQAYKILRHCQERGQQHLSRHQDEIDRIRAELRDLSDVSQPKQIKRAETLGRLKEQMLRIQAPVNQIFYGELVPRLQKLPTRAQRQAVAERTPSNTK